VHYIKLRNWDYHSKKRQNSKKRANLNSAPRKKSNKSSESDSNFNKISKKSVKKIKKTRKRLNSLNRIVKICSKVIILIDLRQPPQKNIRSLPILPLANPLGIL
jgi:hypothetical protein